MNQETELEHYKELIKQYRELLEICYWQLRQVKEPMEKEVGMRELACKNVIKKLESIGIGDTEQRAQIRTDV